MNKRGQSIIEYTLIAVLIILGIVLMGPYIVRSIGAHFKMWDDQIQDSSNEHYTQGSPNDFTNLPGCKCSSSETVGQCGGRGKTITCLPNQKLYYKTCTPANCQIVERCVNDSSCCTGSSRGECGNVPTNATSAEVYPTIKNCYYGQRRLVNYCTGEITGCVNDTSPENIDGDTSCAASCTGTIPVDPATSQPMAAFCPNTQNIQSSMPISFVNNLAACTQSPVSQCRVYCKNGYQLTTDGRSCEPVQQCQTFDIGQTTQYTAISDYVKIYLWSAGGGGAGGGTGNSSKDGGAGGGSALMEAFVKLTPGQVYFFNIGANGTGGSSHSGQGSNGTNGGASWFSSAFTNPQNANLYLTVAPGAGGSPNFGGAGGTTATGKGVECFKVFKGGNGGNIPGVTPGAGGGGGAGGNGQGNAGAGGGSAGLNGENNSDTFPITPLYPNFVPPRPVGGNGGNGGYDLTGSGGQAGATPGGGGGGSGSQFAGGVGGAGRITICQVPDFDANKSRYCENPCPKTPATFSIEDKTNPGNNARFDCAGTVTLNYATGLLTIVGNSTGDRCGGGNTITTYNWRFKVTYLDGTFENFDLTSPEQVISTSSPITHQFGGNWYTVTHTVKNKYVYEGRNGGERISDTVNKKVSFTLNDSASGSRGSAAFGVIENIESSCTDCSGTTANPYCSNQCVVLSVNANDSMINDINIGRPIYFRQNQRLLLTAEAFYDDTERDTCNNNMKSNLPTTASNNLNVVWNSNYGGGNPSQGCAGYALSTDKTTPISSNKTVEFQNNFAQAIAKPGDGRNVRITGIACDTCQYQRFVEDDSFEACEPGFLITDCEDIGTGRNHGIEIRDNGCAAWERDSNYGGSRARMTCTKTGLDERCQSPGQNAGQTTGQSTGINSVGCHPMDNGSLLCTINQNCVSTPSDGIKTRYCTVDLSGNRLQCVWRGNGTACE